MCRRRQQRHNETSSHHRWDFKSRRPCSAAQESFSRKLLRQPVRHLSAPTDRTPTASQVASPRHRRRRSVRTPGADGAMTLNCKYFMMSDQTHQTLGDLWTFEWFRAEAGWTSKRFMGVFRISAAIDLALSIWRRTKSAGWPSWWLMVNAKWALATHIAKEE